MFNSFCKNACKCEWFSVKILSQVELCATFAMQDYDTRDTVFPGVEIIQQLTEKTSNFLNSRVSLCNEITFEGYLIKLRKKGEL